MNFEIRPLIESEFPLWDELVAVSPEGTIFHNSFWLQATGQRFLIYGYFKGGDLFAGIPIMYRSWSGIRRVNQPLLTPYQGVIFKKRETKYVNRISEDKEINLELAKRLKKDFTAGLIQFTTEVKDLQPFIWEGFTPCIRYTYINDLNGSLNDVWQTMNAKRRNDIRKAEADGITANRCDDFDKVYSIVAKTFARQDKTATFKSAAFRYNEALKERGQCTAFLSQNENGEPMAVVYIVWDNKRSYYLLGGYDPERSHHGASSLAMWAAIKFTKEELGLPEFDFEGSMVPQLEQFFRKFGGILTPYYTITWPNPYLKLIPPFARTAIGKVLARLIK